MAGRGNIRLLQIDSDTAQAALQRIERVWSTMGRSNPIRVLTPPTAINTMPLERHEAGPSELDRRPEAALRRGGGRRRGPVGDPPAGPRRQRDRTPADAAPEQNEPTKPVASGASQKTAKLDGGRFRLIAAAANELREDANPTPPPAEVSAPADAAAAGGDSAAIVDGGNAAPLSDRPTERSQPEIIVSVEPGGLVISSSDTEALDAFEALLDAFARQNGSGAARFHLFYLKHVEADVAKTLVEGILAGVSSSTFASSDAAKSALSSLGGGLLGSSLGLGSQGSSSRSALTGSGVRITADSRLNALFVQGSPAEVRLVKELLNVIDEESGPEEVLTFPKPKFIPVYYTSAEEVATVLRQLYADRITAEKSRSQSRSSSGRESIMEAMRGRFGGRGGSSDRGRSSSRNANTKADEGPKMSLGVDTTSNSLIVSAPGPLLKEVEAVVEELDQRAATQNDQDVVVVTLKRANPQLVQESLKGFFGDDVRTSGSTSGTSSRGGTTSRGGPPRGDGGDDARRRFIEAMRARMMGGGDRGGRPDGGRGRDSSGGGRGGRGR